MKLEVGVLGPLDVRLEERPIALASAKQRVVLAALAMRAPRTVTVDLLIEALWPGEPPRSAAHALHVHVSALRKTLGEAACIETQPGGYNLALAAEALDVTLFEQLLAAGRRQLDDDPRAALLTLTRAISLWRGDAYPELRDVPWAVAEVARLEELRLIAIESRVEADLAAGRDTGLVGELRALTREHPYRERLWHQLIRALYRTGRAAEGLAAARELRELLDELGVLPAPELAEIERQILQHDPTLVRPPAPGRAVRDLPAPMTRLLGRRAEVEALTSMLSDPDVRLVTVRGAGGIGKTRLAIEAAHELAQRFDGGAFFVPLGGLRDPALVLPTVAERIGVVVSSPLSLSETIARELGGRATLLVLDNAEHLPDATPAIGELLELTEDLTVLVTSRVRLRLRGECDFTLEPLAVPPADPGDPEVEAHRYPAVALFAERAAAVERGFRLEPDTIDAVAEICRRLDGLPLAIELAAARVALFPLAELRSRLDHRLPLLVAGPRDAPARHQTLRATVAWSEDLLDDDARTLFARLGVFAASFPLEAVEEVAGAGLRDVLGTFEALLDGSLIRHADPGGRFSMLETIREAACERLAELADADAVRERHARWALHEAESTSRELRSGRRRPTLRRLVDQLDDFRAALAWLDQTDAPDALTRLAVALEVAWGTSGHTLEGLGWLTRALASDALAPPLRAAALASAARLAMERGDLNGARAPAEAAAALAAAAEAPAALAAALVALAGIAYYGGDYAGMRALLADAEPLLRVERDEWHLAFSTFAKGSAALSEGRFDEAGMTLARAIDAYERMGDEWGLAGAEMNLAAVHVARGRHEEARPLAERALARYDDLGDRSWRTGALLILAAAVAPVDVRRARELARSAGALALQTGQPVVLPECLISLASFAHVEQHDEDAALLLGAGEGLARRLDLHLGAHERGMVEEIRESLRRRLGDDSQRLESEGSTLSPEDALALVRPG